MAAPAEAPLVFRDRPRFLTVPELEQLSRVCPSADVFRTGFALGDAEVDELLRAAKEIEGAQVFIDPSYPQCLDLSSRIIRLLQLGLDTQFRENDQLINDYNNLREELQEVEERERSAQEELDRLRALRDREQTSDLQGSDLRAKVEDLTRRLDDEYRSNDRMRQQRERDERRVEDLEYRLQRADDDLRTRDDEVKALEEQLRKVQEDYSDMRQNYESLRAEHAAQEVKAQLGDKVRQQEWKIERMMKENRALELQNVELRKQSTDVKQENLEVSEKIVLLDEEVRKLKAREADLESYNQQLGQDKSALLQAQEELRADIAEKLALLDSFEVRFQRQYKSWEDERSSLQAQIEALRREGGGGGGRPARHVRNATGNAGGVDEVEDLREQLNHALEKEVLLLEAYEQLELSVAAEIDKALGRQSEELNTAKRRIDFLTKRIDEDRGSADGLRDHQAKLEEDLQDALLRNQQYEGGVYGLPQAVEEIHQLKDAVYKEQGRVRDLVNQVSNLSRQVEDLSDENSVIRQKAGLPAGAKVDTKDVKMQKEATIAQLRSLNALLERQVADLEEERRKLRMEMKFRAKYHGQHALEMGLTPEQLLLLEQMVDDIKNGRSSEARLVDQLTHRIQFLEVRLAEMMAYADIPPSMRPTLTEFNPGMALGAAQGGGGGGSGYVAGGQGVQQQYAPAAPPASPGVTFFSAPAGASGGLGPTPPGTRAAQLTVIKAALIKSLTMLKEMKTSLGEKRNVSDNDYSRWAEQVISQLVDVEKAVDAILKDAAAAGNAETQQQGVARVVRQVLPDDTLAEAMADELRDKLRQLARQVADLQSVVIQKDAAIQQLMDQKAHIERTLGSCGPGGSRAADLVTRSEHEELQQEAASLKEQLICCLEELSAREREACDLASANARYQSKFQSAVDQVRMLYREYANALSAWKTEKANMDRKAKKLAEDVDGLKAANTELQRGLDVLSSARGLTDVHKELHDTIRRMAVVQIKHARVARQLEVLTTSEQALCGRVEELEQEVRDVSSTCRARLRWLEQAHDQAARRVDTLFRELQASAPLASYQMLVEKHSRQQGELRRLVEEQGQQVVSAEEVFRLRGELAEWIAKYDKLADTNVELKERVRKLEACADKDGLASIDLKLTQELVACKVAADSATRRLSLTESEKSRLQHTLEETQTRLTEIEERLAASASEVELLRSGKAALEQRWQGGRPRQEVQELLNRLERAETAAADKQQDYANLCHKAEEAERKLEQAQRDRKKHLAEITNLRAALRDVSSHREQASVVAKLHEQLDHALAKESLARNALNRSELLRFEAERELRKHRTSAATGGGRMALHQDQARWSERQRVEAQAQLDIVMAGRTEMWKAKLWARKLQHLKQRNDVIASGLDLARRRIKKLEDTAEGACLKLETVEDTKCLLTKGVSEVVRDAARLHEQLLQLKLDRGKLQREEVLMKEKVNYVERVNAELHELLEKYESEFFQQQLCLEGEKSSAVAQSRALQDEVSRLQDRLNTVLVSGGDKDTRHGMDQANKGLGQIRVSDKDIGSRLKAHLSAATAGDREIMLKQIDALRQARVEAEHLRQESHQLKNELSAQGAELSDVRRHHNDALARLKQQSEALLFALNHQRGKGGADQDIVDKMRVVAEATIKELKERLKDREKALDTVQSSLAGEQARWAAQHQQDRKEIERLTAALFDRNNESINNIKAELSRIPGTTAGDGPHCRPQAQDLLDTTTRDLAALRARIQEQEAAYELLQKTSQSEARRLVAEIDRLSSQIASLKQAQKSGPTKSQLDKLETTIRAKDDKLRQLRDAFKVLEGKLIEAHKKITDEACERSNRIGDMMKQKADLEAVIKSQASDVERYKAELIKLRKELSTILSTGMVEVRDGQDVLRKQLAEQCDKVSHLEKELHAARTELQKYKNTERTVMDLTSGMSVEAARQIEDLQNRIRVLTQSNGALKRKLGLGPDDDVDCSAGRDNDDDDTYGPGGAGPRSRPGTSHHDCRRHEHGTTGGPTGAVRSSGHQVHHHPDSVQDQEAKTAHAVAQWEEGKKLNARIEDLKKKLAMKQKEVVASSAEVERLTARVEHVNKELDKQACVIKDLQDRLKQAQSQAQQQPAAVPSVDMAKLQRYVKQLHEAEEAIDKLRADLARTERSAKQGSGGKPSPSSSSTAGGSDQDQLSRDGQMFELQLQRDQAVAQARRLKDRLSDLFGQQAADEAASATASLINRGAGKAAGKVPGSGSGPQRCGSTAGGTSIPGASEADLLNTIANLKSALEKATSTITPTTKYMAELQRRKDAQAEAAAAKKEADKARTQTKTLQKMVAELQQQISDLRRQLKGAQESAAAANAGRVDAGLAAQLQMLQGLLATRDSELATLKALLQDKDRQLAAAASRSSSPAGGLSRDDIRALQAKVAGLEEENNDLKAELDAFDPQFFDEIEDLKHEHFQYTKKVKEYEGFIQQLCSRSGVPAPQGIPFQPSK